MKRIKTVILVASLILSACSSSDDSNDFCSTAVVSTLRACIGDNPEDCEYSLEYATVRPDGTYGERTRIETNEATFNYYFEGERNSIGVICWEGEK